MRRERRELRIILTNDDGLYSPTLLPLWEALCYLGEVSIVVPYGEKSASSHSVTLHRPLVVREETIYGKIKVFAVEGTPADCVMLSTRTLFDDIKLVVSGINIGPNIGWDVFYSGTVGAAREGAMQGLTSFSISLNCNGEEKHLETALLIAQRTADFLLRNPLPPHTFLNINVPNLPKNEVKGIEITRLGKRIYPSPIKEIFREGNKKVFWIGGEIPVDEMVEGTDTLALSNGKVSITPLGLDATELSTMESLKRRKWEEILL